MKILDNTSLLLVLLPWLFILYLCGCKYCFNFLLHSKLILITFNVILWVPYPFNCQFSTLFYWIWCYIYSLVKFQRVRAVFPDAGAAALLKYQWKDANFGFSRYLFSMYRLWPIEYTIETLNSKLDTWCCFSVLCILHMLQQEFKLYRCEACRLD